MALLSALASSVAAGLLGITALPVSAAAAVPAAAVAAAKPIGGIVCSGDLCLQTQSANTANCTAVVNAWADTTSFTGHFEIQAMMPVNTAGVNSSGDQLWPAGGMHASIGIQFFGSPESYQATAWRHNPDRSYTKVGVVNFTINVPSMC
jgi:hypothetical protein